MVALLWNSTFFVCLGLSIFLFTRNYQTGVISLRRFSANKLVLFLLLLLAGINVSVRVLRGYINPHDMMQDLIGAKLLFTSETIYPKDLQHIAEDELRRQGVPALLANIPGVGTETLKSQLYTGGGHPPASSFLLAGPVWLVGIRNTYLLAAIISIVSLSWLVRRLLEYLQLFPDLTLHAYALVWSLAMVWYPVLAALGEGQSGIILSFLVGISWLLLRNDRPFPAGCAIGLAASIKLYPLMLFPYLLLKNRRSFAGALVVFVGLNGILAAWNPANYLAFPQIARSLSLDFSATRKSLAFAGSITALITASEVGTSGGILLWTGLTIIVTGSLSLLLIWKRNKSRTWNTRDDVEFSLFVVAAVFLSPVSWQHYLPIFLLPMSLICKHAMEKQSSRNLAYLLLLMAAFSVPDHAVESLFALVQNYLGFRLAWVVTSIHPLGVVLVLLWLLQIHGRIAAAERETFELHTNN